ncbi:hypothetical protein G3N92_30985, partial [Burkholderia sp. Ac-20379]|nr:hypothetical protein [Burkholderia sp. Ac-20379]
MTLLSPTVIPMPDALPNPRGGAVLLAEAALAEASTASGEALFRALRTAAAALRDAGWLAAARYADALVAAAPGATLPSGGRPNDRFREALRDFRWAIARRNLRELACSPSLHSHHDALRQLAAAEGAAPVDWL